MNDSTTPTPTPGRTDEGLVRAIGVRALAANIVNLIVGSGIFVLPAAVAGILGPASVVAYLACALGIGLLALCFAELGSRVPRSGGTYAYIETAFGPFVGFLAGILGWFGGEVIASAAISVVVVDSALAAVGVEGSGFARAVLLVALLAGLAAANIRGVRTGARLVEVVTAAKLTPLIALIVLGVFFGERHNLAWAGVPAVRDVGRAALLLIFAFTGTEAALAASGEVATPARTIPRAILLGLTVVTTLYIGVHLAAQGILGPELATDQRAPLAAAAGRAIGQGGRQLILAGTLISAFGYLTGNILASPRMLFAFANDGLVPSRLAAVHPRYRTPHVAIATHAALACAFALTGTFRALAVLSVLPTLLVFLGCCLATLVLRRRNVRADGAPFLAPGGPVVPLVTTGFILWLLTSAGRAEVLVVGAMLVIASALYAVRGRLNAGRQPTEQLS
ncbi:MAG TPA: amino acid permease [Gemmatimonadaceae bacterium]|nr:amino acid permease [Gemmatimonadaceae bacterium]